MVPRTSTAASCTFTRLLYEGVQGIDVICLQNFLKTKGFFTGTPTGLYGPATKLSVANWQRASGVVATPKEYGLFGEQSRLLYAKQSAPAPSSPKTNTNTKTTTTKKKTATTTPVCTIKRTLTLKVVGDDVKCLQTYLKKNGYLTQEPNGMYGSSTKAAIVKWQTKNKVKVKKKDLGVFDKKSLSAYKRLAKGKKAGGGGGGGGGSSPSDTTAPTTPTNLLASDVTQTTLTLSWSASTDAVGVSGYKVYQDGSLLSSGITGTTFGVTGLTLNTAYSFTVLAYDAEGNLSSQSDALATTTLSDTTAPTTPGSPSFSSVSTTAITLSWTASTDAVGISGYRIYRGATQVGTTTLLTLTNSSLSSGTSYSYTIEAYDSAGNRSARSATTSTSTLTVDVTSPTAPGTPTFSGVTASSINLTWSSSTDAIGVSGYRIYRGASQVGTSTYATFADSELSASTAYSYTMEAYDATGNRSARSATTSTTTLAASDVTAPTTPGTIAFSDVSYTSITLRWSSSTDAVGVSGYRIYRGSSQVGTSTLALFTNTGLSTSTSYSYTVEAYDIAGNRSARNATTSTSTLSVVSGSAYYVDLSTLSGSDGIKLNGVRGSDSPGFNDLLGVLWRELEI
jgi:chitodextrinase